MPEPVTMVRVSVSPERDESRVNSVDVPPPPVYYVIVGLGPAAVINHTTLRLCEQGQARIGELRVMHIGFPNPWPNYLQHGMGQVPFLLTLPGFHQQPNATGRTLDGGLHSRDFGQAINRQYRLLKDRYRNTDERHGWVAWVQHEDNRDSLPVKDDYDRETGGSEIYAKIRDEMNRANVRNDWPPDAKYRLFVVTLNTHTRQPEVVCVHAAYIDFCTGPGRPAVAGNSKDLEIARTPPWLAPEIWDEELKNRRILNGVDAIVDSIVWQENERICVTAGGGVGLNAAEKARNNDCYLDWFGRNTLNDTFANPRNHTFLQNSGAGRPYHVGELDEFYPIGDARNNMVPIPPNERLRFGKQAMLEAAVNGEHKVTVTLTANGHPMIVDSTNKRLGLFNGNTWDCGDAYLTAAKQNTHAAESWPSQEYDRLVIPNGQQPNQLGQPRRFTELHPFEPLTAEDGRMVALQNHDGDVRLLGAACQVYPGFNLASFHPPAVNTPSDHMWAYRATLAVSAVPDGFILSGTNIATANGYFDQFPNDNINTMTHAQIKDALPTLENHAACSETLADAIVTCRNAANGYADFAALMQAVNPTLNGHPLVAQDEDAFKHAFRFDYP